MITDQYRVYQCSNGRYSVVSRTVFSCHENKQEAIDACSHLNEAERKNNGGKLDGGHYYQTDADDLD